MLQQQTALYDVGALQLILHLGMALLVGVHNVDDVSGKASLQVFDPRMSVLYLCDQNRMTGSQSTRVPWVSCSMALPMHQLNP